MDRLVLFGLLALVSGCDAPAHAGQGAAPTSSVEAHPASVAPAAKTHSIETQRKDPLGRQVRVACVTCHSLRKADELPQSTAELNEFHRGLELRHGNLACSSCHAKERPHEELRLASGKLVEMADVQELCAQCHGPQKKSYDKGAHGGMTGYWDTRQGKRVKNDCVHCHDPHAPAFVGAQPVLPPRDRGLTLGEKHP